MKKRRFLLSGMIGLLLLLACFFLYNKNSHPVILEFGMFTGSNWDVASANSFKIFDRAIADFEKNHPNVKIHYYSGIAKEDYSEWCAGKLLEGKTPDVFMVLDSDFDKFTSLGVMKNLDDLMSSDDSFHKEDFFATALDTGRNGGHQYALPYEVVPTLMFVNKSLLAKEGIDMPKEDWTWEDMAEICQRVTKDTDQDGLLDQFGTYNYSWRDALYTCGGKLYENNQAQISFTDSRVLNAVKYIKRLNDINQGQSVTQEDFNAGRVAFMPLTFAEYRTYKTYPYRIKKYTKFQWDCITFPADKEGGNISKVDALLIGIGSKTRQEALAWEFLKQLTYTGEMQMDVYRYSQGVPALRAVASSQEGVNCLQEDMDEGEQVISSTLLCHVIENGIIEPKLLQYQQVMNLADGEVSKILQENKNVDSSMKIFQRTVSKYLQQQK
ncbi:carbohydrate ABC transporter substrate-binding protein (CUT1 family) [Lacrimispora xylanisolvens]|uniref:Carbohydrate ABC transporter substrate-binding protein (CUT1 family) n=1 Tax=Lacrimispora xylanisolvens TaxID=384636 RepID=A0A2S6HWH0_9FIRM|nr:extracellular solute-binding protein [Hungatella xylanolytica]PPK82203.1 carbohydrate ABC transporter substrate-binding protein (CUT1 family) [Hungatella xylanolytica]